MLGRSLSDVAIATGVLSAEGEPASSQSAVLANASC